MLDRQAFLGNILALYTRLRDCARSLVSPVDPDDDLNQFLVGQLDFYSQRCIAISHLLQANLLWDAELVFRSALESAVKTLFVLAASDVERHARLTEFREHLSGIEIYRYRNRAAATASANQASGRMASALKVTAEEDLEQKSIRTKAARKTLEQKWAFSEITKSLSVGKRGEPELSLLRNLSHSYGVASHFLHADQLAIHLAVDRELREPHVKELLESLHFTEMAIRQVVILSSVIHTVADVLGKTVDLSQTIKQIEVMTDVCEGIRNELFEAESHLYGASRT